MKKCSNCQNDRLMVSQKESKVIQGAKYVACPNCGNIMLLINDIIVPTPTDNSPQTKLLIQDAADCFDSLAMLGAASLDGQTTPVDIQPTQALENANKYVENAINAALEDEEEYHEEEYDDLESEHYEDDYKDDYEDDECTCSEYVCDNYIEEMKEEIMNDPFRPEGNDYLLILPSGEKQMFRNTSKEFMVNIINDIGSHIMLYELKPIELKKEVKYSF